MYIEQQVTDFETSKKLYELGIKNESYFHWYVSQRSGYSFILESKTCNSVVDSQDTYDVYSAYTASEVMELLPDRIIIPEKAPFDCYRFRMARSLVVEDGTQAYPTFVINYFCDTLEAIGKRAFAEKKLFEHNIWAKTLPYALAKTLITLKENHLLETPSMV